MGRRGIELEVKFAPADEETLADLATRATFPGWRVTARHEAAQRNTYYDTAAGSLEAARCSLRRRVLDDGAGGVEWTFKRGQGPGRDGVARRREVNVLLPASSAKQEATDLPPCKPVARARKIAGTAPLLPLFTLLTRRQEIELAHATGTRLSLALDRLEMADHPNYQETEIEIELLDGDEQGMAEFALWLMATYGLLPMRGSKRGRALAWLRGEGLPVVSHTLGLRLIAERARALAAQTTGRPVVVALASPRGSAQAHAVAKALPDYLPDARLITGVTGTPDPPGAAGNGTVIVEGPAVLGADATHSDLGVWVKAGLPHPLLARLLGDARHAGRDAWDILRRFGAYVVPLQRRFLDPAAHWADLVITGDAPTPDPCHAGTPDEQVKLFGWPDEAALATAGAAPLDARGEWEHDYFFSPPADQSGRMVRARVHQDTAWVSFIAGDRAETDREGPAVVTFEARPRVLTLLHGLGYTLVGELRKERRRYGLDGWEVTLDRIAGLGHFCELRRLPGGPASAVDQREARAALGLSGARTTSATYLALWQEAQREQPPVLDGAALQATLPGANLGIAPRT